MNDVVRLAAVQAARAYGSSSDFNAACFSGALTRIADCHDPMDGKLVRAILCGRADIEVLDACMFRVKGAHDANG